MHPNYSSATLNNDIAMLKLAQAVDLGTYIPACLPDTTADFTGKAAKVYGELTWNLPHLTSAQAGVRRTPAAPGAR